jgi:hypothetical protein
VKRLSYCLVLTFEGFDREVRFCGEMVGFEIEKK